MANLFKALAQRARRGEIYSTREYWNGKAEALDGSSVSMWPNTHLNALYHTEQTVRLDDLLGDLAGHDALDVGCGTGRMSRFLTSRGASVTGTDFADSALDIARSVESDRPISYRHESVFDLSDKAQYDLITSWGVLVIACRTVEELDKALNRLRVSMRPGGRIMLMEPVHDSFLHRVLKLDQDGFLDAMHRAGFTVDQVEHFHFWPTRLMLAYIPWPAGFTRWVYRMGQSVMSVMFKRRRFGDYMLFVGRAT